MLLRLANVPAAVHPLVERMQEMLGPNPPSLLEVAAFWKWRQDLGSPGLNAWNPYPGLPPNEGEVRMWWNLFLQCAQDSLLTPEWAQINLNQQEIAHIRRLTQGPNILWVLQSEGFRGSDNTLLLKDALDTQGTKWVEVNLVPFCDAPVEVPGYEPGMQLVFYGSTSFRDRVMADSRWRPHMAFHAQNFTIESQMREWGDQWLLNGQARRITVGEFLDIEAEGDELVFIRPDGDTKSLVGAVQTVPEWKDAIRLSMNNTRGPTLDTLILLGIPQNIVRECRFFLVDGWPVAASTYRLHGYRNVHEPVPFSMWETVMDLMQDYSPEKFVVLDLCELMDGTHKIVETNCFHCSGFYSCDVQAIVRAVNHHLRGFPVG